MGEVPVEATGSRLAEEIANAALVSGRTIAVAESLTAGHATALLGSAPDASRWLRGGVIAYAPEVKFDVLGVTPGPVICSSCAREMAVGVRRLLDADIGVAATGVGGPGPEEGMHPGTVFLACAQANGEVDVREEQIDGPPERVVEMTVILMLNLIYEALVEVSVAN